MFPPFLILKVALVVISYLGFAFVSVFILRYIGNYFKEIKSKGFYQLTRILMGVILLPVVLPSIILPIAYVDATVIEPNWIEVSKISVKAPNFNVGLQSLKIVQITDLHIEKVGPREKSLIKIINGLKPDIILTNGDFINSEEGWAPCLAVLKQLKASKGIYTILGNTDYYFGKENEIIAMLQSIGIIVLKHDNLKLDFGEKGSFWLVGISYKYGLLARYGEPKYVQMAFEGIPAHEPKILLIHNPKQAELEGVQHHRPQLILAGDTHGGQFGIEFIRKLSPYADRGKYMAGMFDVQGIPLYVNRGIGMKTLYLRFLCRPEITVVRLVNG